MRTQQDPSLVTALPPNAVMSTRDSGVSRSTRDRDKAGGTERVVLDGPICVCQSPLGDEPVVRRTAGRSVPEPFQALISFTLSRA